MNLFQRGELSIITVITAGMDTTLGADSEDEEEECREGEEEPKDEGIQKILYTSLRKSASLEAVECTEEDMTRDIGAMAGIEEVDTFPAATEITEATDGTITVNITVIIIMGRRTTHPTIRGRMINRGTASHTRTR